MFQPKIALITATLVVGSFAFSASAFANTCPESLQQDSEGYWFSDAKPGWKSHTSTDKGVTLNAQDFGGVVYSPKRHRLACVYKTSDGKWIALVSQVHNAIKITQAKDDSGKGPAWIYSQQHGDYACGKPNVNSITNCAFTFEE